MDYFLCSPFNVLLNYRNLHINLFCPLQDNVIFLAKRHNFEEIFNQQQLISDIIK